MTKFRGWCCLLWSIFLSFSLEAQEQFAYRVYFKDKAGSLSIHQPLDFLSQRALDRRQQWNIPLDSTDLPVAKPYLDSVQMHTQGIIHVTSRWLNTCVVLVDDPANVSLLDTKPFVDSVKLVGYYPSGLHQKSQIPSTNEPLETEMAAKTTADPAHYGFAWGQTHILYGECLHDKGYWGQGKIIAVLDDGFMYVNSGPAFQSLVSSGRIVDTYDFVHQDAPVYLYGTHGTEVLSTISGYIPGTYVGSAPEASIALYITEDNTSEQPIEMDNMIAGMERADSLGADVLSSSLGYDVFHGPAAYTIPPHERDGKSVIVTRAANLASSKGMLLVISAGNEGPGGLLVPGDADSVITVGNVDVNGVPASSSGYGPNASLHTKPDVCAQGNPAAVMRNTNQIYFSIGTSLSTPQIAGYMACVLQASPGVSLPRIKEIVRQSGHTYANPGIQYGYGIPNFCTVWNKLSTDEIPSPNEHIRLYPNPCQNCTELTFQTPYSLSGPVSMSITDIHGQCVYQSQWETKTGNHIHSMTLTQQIPMGIYIVKLTTSKQSYSFKWVVN
jgi:serine protease AprX